MLCKCGEPLLWGDQCGACDHEELLELRAKLADRAEYVAALEEVASGALEMCESIRRGDPSTWTVRAGLAKLDALKTPEQPR